MISEQSYLVSILTHGGCILVIEVVFIHGISQQHEGSDESLTSEEHREVASPPQEELRDVIDAEASSCIAQSCQMSGLDHRQEVVFLWDVQ